MRVAHAITDLDGMFVEVDTAFCALLQFPDKELFAKTLLDVTHEADRQRNGRMLHELVEHGKGFTIEKRYRRADGGVVKVKNHVSRTMSADGHARIAASVVCLDDYEKIAVLLRQAQDKAQDMERRTRDLRFALRAAKEYSHDRK